MPTLKHTKANTVNRATVRASTHGEVCSVDRPGIRRPILSEDVISFTECRGKLGEYFEKTRKTHRPIIITQNGKPTSVLVSITDWEAAAPYNDIETLELLDDVRAAEEEIERGEVISHEDFMAQLRAEGRL